jgi:hypothetical protein
MSKLVEKHRLLWSQKSFLLGVALGLALLVLGTVATYYANSYTTTHASNYVTDIILDNIPVVKIDFVFSEGATIFVIFLIALAALEPRRIPFMLKSIAIFMITRSIFMTLTHLAPPPYQSYIDPTDLIRKISSGDDLFFSGHTGMPFLLALSFWDNKWLRYIFIAMTVIGGAAVLLGHLHYSIDVFSALFITYGIFVIAKKIFARDYLLFKAND